MMMEYFGNDKYKVLSCMAQRQIAVNNNLIVKLSQQEISSIVNLSKVKVNAIISELKENGYITQRSTRGQYMITDKVPKELFEISTFGGNNE